MKRKEKFNILLLIAAIPLLGAIYYTSNINVLYNKATVEPKIVLNKNNTPKDVTGNVQWDREDFNCTHRYTDFHYKYITNKSNAHITLANYGHGGYIQNSSPLIYDYTINFSITANSWAGVEVLASNTYSTNLRQDYDTKETYILASYLGSLTQTITLSLTEPYFSIWKYNGAEVQLNYLTIDYSC